MAPRRVRILLIEDRVADAELVLAALRRAGIDPEWERVDDEAGFRAKLRDGSDLILCDFSLPQFDALLALSILKESGLDIPFIIVSGTIGEQEAVDSMKGGASDYFFKDSLARLGAAATRELDAADQRRAAVKAREESGARFSAMIGSSLDAVVVMDDAGRILDWNPQAEALFGWTAHEAIGQVVSETIVPPALRAAHQTGLARYLDTGESHLLNRRMELTAMHRDGHEFPVELSVARITVDGVLSFSAFVRDITERKRADRMRDAHSAVSRAISERGSLESVLGKALGAVGSKLGWDVGQVWLRNEGDGMLRCFYQWVAPAAHVAKFESDSAAARFEPGEGMVGQVWLSRQSVWLEDLSLAPDARLAEAAVSAGLTSAVFAPVFAGSEVNGVVQFFSHARRPADPALLQLMSDLSGRVGDFTSRAQSAVALRQSESRFRGLFYNVGVAKAIIALPSGVVEAVNPALSTLLGYEEEDVIGKSSSILFDLGGHQPNPFMVPARSPASPAFQGDVELRRKDGVLVWASLSVTTTFNDSGQPQSLLFQAQDITKRREAEKALAEAQVQLRHRAGHDALTELPNRIHLQERLQELVAGPHDHLSLLVLDLDHFKEVNDFFGHVAGDELLKQIGPRIKARLRRSDGVARIGGDEFGLILAGADSSIAGRLAEEVSAALAQPFTVQGQAMVVEASIGIASYPEHGTTAEELMRRADIALHVAKRSPGTIATYSPDFEGEGASRLALMADLRAAIQNNDLAVYYQPLVDLKSGLVVRFEALLRWPHPVRGLIPPDHFIPFAEQTGVIQPLTDWVLRNVLEQIRRWHEAGHDLAVAVNISMRNLMDPGLAERIAVLLEDVPSAAPGGAPPLSLEVTEGVVMADPKRAVERLTQLRRLGIRLSVDDFGTGYSSLAYLSRLPINEMKIDRSFIFGIADDPNKAAVVRAALDLGHNLRLEVVAEGVEDRRTWDLLFVLGCDIAQGYYIRPPMPAEAVLPWLLSSPYGGVAPTVTLAAA